MYTYRRIKFEKYHKWLSFASLEWEICGSGLKFVQIKLKITDMVIESSNFIRKKYFDR